MKPEPEKLDWVANLGRQICWICGYDWGKFNAGDMRRYQTHHIERRSIATGVKEDGTPRYDDKCNFFAACELCHVTELDTMPHAKQLAYKMKYDNENFSLDRWLRLKDPDLKAQDRVTLDEIMDEREKL